MTRKDYILIAEALRDTRKDIQTTAPGVIMSPMYAVNYASEKIAYTLARDNRAFDRDHFLAVVRGEKDLNSRPARKHTRQVMAETEALDSVFNTPEQDA